MASNTPAIRPLRATAKTFKSDGLSSPPATPAKASIAVPPVGFSPSGRIALSTQITAAENDKKKQDEQILEKSPQSNLLDLRPSVALSLELEMKLHPSSKLTAPTSEEIPQLKAKQATLQTLTSLDQLLYSPICASSSTHAGYLTFSTFALLEDPPESSREHFFSKNLNEAQIRARYLEPTSMPGVLRIVAQQHQVDDELLESMANSGVPSAEDVANGVDLSSLPPQSSVLRRLDETYDLLDPTYDDADLRRIIREQNHENRVLAWKKRQRPAVLPVPSYSGCPSISLNDTTDYLNPRNSSLLKISDTFEAPTPFPAFLMGPASKKRRLYIQGGIPVVEYRFRDMEVHDEESETSALGEGNMTWLMLVKREVPRVARMHAENRRIRRESAQILAKAASNLMTSRVLQVRAKSAQAIQTSKAIAKSVYTFIKRNEKEWRKQADKEAEASRKAEEEVEENERAQKKLSFLLTQTELYSHFMSKKLGLPEAEAEVEKLKGTGPNGAIAKNVMEEKVDSEAANKARAEALHAWKEQRAKVDAFDEQSSQLRGHRKTGGLVSQNLGGAAAKSSAEPSLIEQPRHLVGTLKPYQVKGLNWLYNLYEQGINGILADEMGLGKTVQTIAMLAHLAETRGIWGPFIVIAPTSTLPNWVAEITKFYPQFKVLPYWGVAKQRAVLRKLLQPHYLHRADSAVHVVVTSYNLVVHDEKFISRIHWEYMILDEAHAIKSAKSVRWTTLLSFGHTRNRLLLTGTPIQNNMAELWALLHFIMPTLFDSHNEFAEWFSKDIEEHAAGSGSLNEFQLNRLHMILKPFMLRRVKVDVQNELPPKTEIQVKCDMTARQLALYNGIRNKMSVGELFDKINVPLGRLAAERQAKTLMNIVMQFRNVCNHPEILERSETESPLQFSPLAPPMVSYNNIMASANHNFICFNLPKLIASETMWELPLFQAGRKAEQATRQKWLLHRFSVYSPLHVHSSIFNRNYDYIEISQQTNQDVAAAPKITTQGTKISIKELSSTKKFGSSSLRASQTTPSSLRKGSSKDIPVLEPADLERDHCWDFVRLSDLNPSEIDWLHNVDVFRRWFAVLGARERDIQLAYKIQPVEEDDRDANHMQVTSEVGDACHSSIRPLQTKNTILRLANVETTLSNHDLESYAVLCDLVVSDPMRRMKEHFGAIRAARDAYHPRVWSAAPGIYCNDRRFMSYQDQMQHDNFVTQLLLGGAKSENGPEFLCRQVSSVRLARPTVPMARTILDIVGSCAIRVPNYAELVRDSGKLKELDNLLKRLKKEKHRVLVYSQFTEVLDLLEDFMFVRGHKFVRLDGSSKLDDRRDMVDAFQTDLSIFVFLLSTRAGGLGINLTAADTVIFYDSDWNPTMDAQAMDRAHRLGQTRPVTVYRLVTRNSVEERILLRAKQKGTMQNLVIQGGRFNLNPDEADEIFNSRPSEMLDLLMDDTQLDKVNKADSAKKKRMIINPIIPGMKRSAKPTKPSAASKSGAASSTLTVDEAVDSSEPVPPPDHQDTTTTRTAQTETSSSDATSTPAAATTQRAPNATSRKPAAMASSTTESSVSMDIDE